MARRGMWLKVLLGTVALFLLWLSSLAWAPRFFGREAFARARGDTIIGWGAFVFSLLIMVVAFWPEIRRYLLGGAARERRILQTGRPARATVVSLGENSGGGVVTVNDQPYLNLVLEVHDGFSAPYAVSMDLVIPRAAVPQFQPGAVIPVKVDPADPRNVVIDW